MYNFAKRTQQISAAKRMKGGIQESNGKSQIYQINFKLYSLNEVKSLNLG